MTPQSQLNRAIGGLTRKADACKKTETFGQVSSAVKQSANKRQDGEISEASLFGAPTPKILTESGKTVLMDDFDFEESFL